MSRRLPTTDLYFHHSCGDWIKRWWRSGPIEAIGDNCYRSGDTMLLVRRDEEAVMNRALQWPGRLAYLVDDDIAGAASSPGLPDAYRRKLAAFDSAFHQPLIRRADIVLVSSDPLADLFGTNPAVRCPVQRIDPYWGKPLADQAHFTPLERGGPLRIVHLGSASHGGAFGALAPAITALLERHEDVTFTYIGHAPPQGTLERHPRVRRVPPMRWPRYRNWLTRQRFHLALYPLDSSRFDRARSVNKIIEHGIVGAVGLYPDDWAPGASLGDAALHAPADPAAWGPALEQAVRDRRHLAATASRAASALAPLLDPAIQRSIWSKVFDLGIA